MTDQKANFSPRGLLTEFVGGNHDAEKPIYQSVITGNCQLVYMTAESLFLSPVWWEMFGTLCA